MTSTLESLSGYMTIRRCIVVAALGIGIIGTVLVVILVIVAILFFARRA